jgi:hypothetical protein
MVSAGAVHASFEIPWNVVASGGGFASNATFELEGTIGQPIAGGELTGGSFSLVAGYGALPETVGCLGDFDGNAVVDAADLATFLGVWGTGDDSADFDQSGTVDAGDLAVLLGAWGPCP